jgi:hypothetical protein
MKYRAKSFLTFYGSEILGSEGARKIEGMSRFYKKQEKEHEVSRCYFGPGEPSMRLLAMNFWNIEVFGSAGEKKIKRGAVVLYQAKQGRGHTSATCCFGPKKSSTCHIASSVLNYRICLIWLREQVD